MPNFQVGHVKDLLITHYLNLYVQWRLDSGDWICVCVTHHQCNVVRLSQIIEPWHFQGTNAPYRPTRQPLLRPCCNFPYCSTSLSSGVEDTHMAFTLAVSLPGLDEIEETVHIFSPHPNTCPSRRDKQPRQLCHSTHKNTEITSSQ